MAATAVLLIGSGASVGCTSDTTTTVSSVSSTSTTLAPGAMTFDTCTDRFETLIRRESLPGTLPYSVMADEEVAWLSEAAPQVTITQARGYRLANGGLVLLFFCEPPAEDPSSAPAQALTAAAKDRYTRNDEETWAFIGEVFGYVIVSKEYRSQLGTFAQWARSAHQKLIDGE